MPKRSSLRARLDQGQARGQEAIYGQPDPAPAAGPRPRAAGSASWDATHQRVTFYCPEDRLADIEADMERTGQSKTGVIVDALREHLSRP